VPDREVEPGSIVTSIGPLRDANETLDHPVRGAHDAQQALDLDRVAHELGHSFLAFGYNTAILSIAVGFLTGL
jgi:hypothetical protein